MDSNSEYDKKNPPGCKQMMIWGIPVRLRKMFKAKCAEQNVTMRQTFIKLMREFVHGKSQDA